MTNRACKNCGRDLTMQSKHFFGSWGSDEIYCLTCGHAKEKSLTAAVVVVEGR